MFQSIFSSQVTHPLTVLFSLTRFCIQRQLWIWKTLRQLPRLRSSTMPDFFLRCSYHKWYLYFYTYCSIPHSCTWEDLWTQDEHRFWSAQYNGNKFHILTNLWTCFSLNGLRCGKQWSSSTSFLLKTDRHFDGLFTTCILFLPALPTVTLKKYFLRLYHLLLLRWLLLLWQGQEWSTWAVRTRFTISTISIFSHL